MSVKSTVSEHQSGFLFLVGLVSAAGLAIALDTGGQLMTSRAEEGMMPHEARDVTIASLRELTEEDLQAAKVAWQYIRVNTREETGLVDSVANFPSTTLWDQGSYLLALLSAKTLGLVERDEFDLRLGRALSSLASLPLFEGKLPNKVYNTQTLAMTDYQNTPAPGGIGWSALDIARVLSALRAIERAEPQYGAQIRQLLSTWDLNAMAQDGQLVGARRDGASVAHPQEGRIGYEQYAARASALWGLDVLGVISARPIVKWVTVAGVEIPTDRRDHSTFQAITPVLSEPFILQGLELGLDSEASVMASRVYRAQEARFKETGQLTMVSEDHVDQAPYFLYSAVHSNGEPWAVVNEDGRHFSELRTISLKSAFAWDALYNTEYTQFLRQELSAIADLERGWPAGVYERDGKVNTAFTLNTNAIVLEAIHHIAYGPLWQAR